MSNKKDQIKSPKTNYIVHKSVCKRRWGVECQGCELSIGKKSHLKEMIGSILLLGILLPIAHVITMFT